MISDLAGRNFVEELLGTRNFRLLDGLELQRFHCTLGLSNEIDVLYRPFVEGDSPVRGIVADRCRNMESLGELCVNANLFCGIQILNKLALAAHAVSGVTIGKHIILNGFLREESFLKAVAGFLSGEDKIAIDYELSVRPTYKAEDVLPENVEETAFKRNAEWFYREMVYNHHGNLGVFEGYTLKLPQTFFNKVLWGYVWELN